VGSFARERNTKLHAVADADGRPIRGRPIRFFMTAGQKRRSQRRCGPAGQLAQRAMAAG